MTTRRIDLTQDRRADLMKCSRSQLVEKLLTVEDELAKIRQERDRALALLARFVDRERTAP